MTDPGRGGRLPRSYRSGRLLGLVANDFPEHHLELVGPGRGRLVPDDGGVDIEVTERVDRRFLGHTEIAQFRMQTPSSSADGARMRVTHTGAVRRQGVRVEVLSGGEDVHRMAGQIEQDPSFAGPALALDFTHFEMDRSGSTWTVMVELMGASFVSLAMPPMRSYVRLHQDQREALVTALAALPRHLSGS